MENKVTFKDIGAIDGHLHMHYWYDKNKNVDFLHGYEEYKEVTGLKAINIASLPSGAASTRDVSNNILCALCKLANDNIYIHGGFIYPEYPLNPEKMQGMDILTQYNELMEIGFDGIKMLEGKPNLYSLVKYPICGEAYAPFFKQAEKDGTHILMHVNDPEIFWDKENAPQYLKDKGWFYGEGDYISNVEMYAQIDTLLENNPELNLTLAHFFFKSASPEELEAMFSKYKNLAVDITPGGEMYLGFKKRPEYFRDFFTKYDERIVFGTDGDFPTCMPAMEWLCDRIFRFLATDEEIKSFEDEMIKGIKIPVESVKKIMGTNFENRVSPTPRSINKEALKRYIEKYKHLIREQGAFEIIEKYAKELLY